LCRLESASSKGLHGDALLLESPRNGATAFFGLKCPVPDFRRKDGQASPASRGFSLSGTGALCPTMTESCAGAASVRPGRGVFKFSLLMIKSLSVSDAERNTDPGRIKGRFHT
jgi:hypothetical protein